MLCYQDRTFCAGDGCAKFHGCHRELTEAVKAGAEKSGLQISRFINPSRKHPRHDDRSPIPSGLHRVPRGRRVVGISKRRPAMKLILSIILAAQVPLWAVVAHLHLFN